MTEYDEAQLFVAAIRMLTHRQSSPPSVEEVSESLLLTAEWGHAVCRKLEKQQIIKVSATPFSTKLFIADHLKIEEFSKKEETKGLNKEIEKFQASRQNMDKKVEAIQAELAEKKKNMFAELEKSLKDKQKKRQ